MRGAVDPVEVRGEADALGRVLENLIENGLVHGPPDGAVTVSVRRRGDVALVTVRDEGHGPSPEQHERVFERFWRGPERPSGRVRAWGCRSSRRSSSATGAG